MALTETQVQELFANYNNINFTTAKEFVSYVFSLPDAEALANYVPLAGTGTNFITGALKVKQGGALDFYNNGGVLQAGITWVGNVLYFLGQAAGQGLNISGWNSVSINPTALGFFGTSPIAKQSINNTALTNPAGGATVDAEARTAINNLNTVVNSIRTQLLAVGLFS